MPLSSDQQRAVEALFDAASVLPLAEQAALVRARSDDPDVRQEVISLLRHMADETLAALQTDAMPQPEIPRPAGPPQEAPGQRIGHYQLQKQLGEGGFGTVWLASQQEPVQRTVALKIIKLGMDTRQVIARFEAERQTLALMDHPHIAKVFDAGTTENGRPFFVMEYIEGEPLVRYCDRHQLDTGTRLRIFTEVCQALQHAHQKGIIHRDIKPSNVLVTLQDGVPVPKVIDFGIAKATNSEQAQRTLLTDQKQVIGTPAYMAPEQADLGQLDIDTRCDIYSLGVLLYELLTGSTPFDQDSLASASLVEMMRIIREDDPPRPSTRIANLDDSQSSVGRDRSTQLRQLRSTLRGDLDWIVMRCLEKDRARRYASAAELGADVQRHLADEPVLAGPPSASYRARKFVRRNRGQVVAGALIALVLIGGIVGTSVGMIRAWDAEKEAREQARRAEREAANAKAVNDFLNQDLLRGVDPGRAEDREITMREVLDLAAERVGGSFADQPEVEASIRTTLAVTYWRLGRPDLGEPQAIAAAARSEEALGPGHPDTLVAHHLLSTLYLEQRRFEEARDLLEAQLEVARQHLPPEEPLILRLLHNLSAAYFQLGDTERGLVVLNDTLGAKRRILGDRDPSTMSSINSLGTIYYLQGSYQKAADLFEELLAARTEELGEADPQTLRTASSYGPTLLSLGREQEAEQVLRDAWTLATDRLGPDHPTTEGITRRLGNVLSSREKHDEALELLQGLARQMHARTGPDDYNTLLNDLDLTGALCEARRCDEAVERSAVLLERARKLVGPNHQAYAFALLRRSISLKCSDQLDAAIEPLKEAIEILTAAGSFSRGELRTFVKEVIVQLEYWNERHPDQLRNDELEAYRRQLDGIDAAVAAEEQPDG